MRDFWSFALTTLLATSAAAQGESADPPTGQAEGEMTHDVMASSAATEPGDRSNRFEMAFDGYLRVEAGTILPERFFGVKMPMDFNQDPIVGRNDGFALGDARLNFRATYHDNLYVRLGFDGAVTTYSGVDDPIGRLSTGLKDAYVRYTFVPQLSLYAGRFKPPYDVEELRPTEKQFFAHRALESRGVLSTEGPHTDLFGRTDMGGFAPKRQLGLMIGSDALLGFGDNRLGYALAVTNGNSGDAAHNDNDLPAAWLRLFATFGSNAVQPKDDEEGPATYDVRGGGMVGLSGFYNQLTTGIAPSRYRDNVVGVGFDVAYQILVFHFQGQILAAAIDSVTRTDVPRAYSIGGHGQIAMQVPNTAFYPAFRFALLDPRWVRGDSVDSALSPDEDKVMHYTVGVSYRPEDLPALFYLEYTRSVEQQGRQTDNDRVEAAVQVTFQ